MADLLIQRVVMPPRAELRRLYYRCRRSPSNERPIPRRQGRRAIVLPRGSVLRTDTWFNAFFESYWRKYTTIKQLLLCVRVRGAGSLRIYRRSCDGSQQLLKAMHFAGRDCELRIEVPEPSAHAGGGLLFFEMQARSHRLRMRQAEWLAGAVVPRPARLVAAFCTFNRAPLLVRNLAALLDDADVAQILERIVVVDQGEDRVRDQAAFEHLARRAGGRLHLLEQANFGGSGGFTRCLLEAQRIPSATHVLLMDDDAVLEPECVLRAAALLALARDESAVGGHMLDADRPAEVVESGSRFRPRHIRIDEPSRRRVDHAEGLTPFLEDRPRHYNGWWFLAFPLAALERAGLPLPLFLRGDDVEFGCRLLQQGIPTLTPPGVAVWHEPFERKGRGWHAFYELRNLLIVGALHFPAVGALTLARRFLSRLLDELLAYDYYDGWLLCAAAADFLRGPKTLCEPPLATHQRLLTVRERLAPVHQPRAEITLVASSTRRPRGRLGVRLRRLGLVFRNLVLSSPSAESKPEQLFRGGGEQWYNVAGADVVAVEEPHRDDLIVLRRSRGHFVRLLLRGLWLALRLICQHRRAARQWRLCSGQMMTRRFWAEYLGLSAAPGSRLPAMRERSTQAGGSVTRVVAPPA
jgi:galactofuranosylgalactofuranosylrhamnosyl-N-acetylglucosaminyl-diphospho-decaprenol beta-1,5/1,6-galactofuranosyltransferase